MSSNAKNKKQNKKKLHLSLSPFSIVFSFDCLLIWFFFTRHQVSVSFKKSPQKSYKKKFKKILSFFNFSLEFLFQFLSLSLFSFFLRLFELIRCFILSNSTSLFSVLHSTFYIQPRTVFFQSTEATPTSLPYCLPYLTGEEEKKINTHVHCQKFRRYFYYYCARHLHRWNDQCTFKLLWQAFEFSQISDLYFVLLQRFELASWALAMRDSKK